MGKNDKSVELFQVEFTSGKSNRKKIIDFIINNITNAAIPITLKKRELYLVIDEAITNAMDHGNNWDNNKFIKIKGVKKEDLFISIKDEGQGFDPKHIDKEPKKKPGGRGIRIIKHYCDPKWNKKGNRIELVIPVKYTKTVI